MVYLLLHHQVSLECHQCPHLPLVYTIPVCLLHMEVCHQDHLCRQCHLLLVVDSVLLRQDLHLLRLHHGDLPEVQCQDFLHRLEDFHLHRIGEDQEVHLRLHVHQCLHLSDRQCHQGHRLHNDRKIRLI